MELQKRYSEKYNAFFSSYELIVSWHFGFNWFPSWVVESSKFVSIKQKVKQKCFLWLKKVHKSWIFIKEVVMYDWNEILEYKKDGFWNHYDASIEFLTKELGLSEKNVWYEVWVFSESARGEWVWFTGTFYALLTTAILINTWELSEGIIRDYPSFEKSSICRKIKQYAHQATWITKHGNTWSAFLTTLIWSGHPHVYMTQSDTVWSVEDVSYIQEYTKTLPELFWVSPYPLPSIPVRRALLFTGERSNTLFVQKQAAFSRKMNMEYQDRFLEQDFDGLQTKLHEDLLKTSYYDTKQQWLTNMSIKTLHIFSEIYVRWPQEWLMEELISHLNTINRMYNDIEQDYDVTKDFTRACIERKVDPNMFWFMPIYTNKYGGNYLVVFDWESDLDVLDDVVLSMKPLYPHMQIRDVYDFENPPKDWISVEQNLFSSNVTKWNQDMYVLHNANWEQKFMQYTDINSEETRWLFLDAIKNKVYFDGEQLTSKHIKSATTTIDVFEKLLQASDKKVKNTDLWPSSFSWQQNQMLWKIIYPLVKYIKTKINEDFPLTSSGSLRQFYITLGKTKIPVQLIKKIN